MRIYWNAIKRLIIPWAIATVIYILALSFSIYTANSDSLITYAIQPYLFGSEPVDLFFPLFATIPFSWYVFFIKKDNLLQYVATRANPQSYLNRQISAGLTLCFLMVFLVNMAGVLLSVTIANIHPGFQDNYLEGYILGEIQMTDPLRFGFIWSAYKACIGMLICLMGQIIALYVKNFFLALLTPFVYVILENFITAIFGLSKYSFTTSFVLNRLSPNAITPGNIAIGLSVFSLVLIAITTHLKKHEQAQI